MYINVKHIWKNCFLYHFVNFDEFVCLSVYGPPRRKFFCYFKPIHVSNCVNFCKLMIFF